MRTLHTLKHLVPLSLFALSGVSYGQAVYDKTISSGIVNVNAASDIVGASGLLSKLDLGSPDFSNPVRINILQDLGFTATANTADQRLRSGYLETTPGTWTQASRHTIIDVASGKTFTISGNDLNNNVGAALTVIIPSSGTSGEFGSQTIASLTMGTLGGTGRVVFQNNKVYDATGTMNLAGGAVYASATYASAGKLELTFNNTDFIANSANSSGANNMMGGAIYFTGASAAANAKSLLTINNSTFQNNEANSYADGAHTYAGAINLRGGVNASINDTSFTGNTALGNAANYAGAINLEHTFTELTLTDSSFTSNKTGGDGGAIHSNGILGITDTTFHKNEAGSGITGNTGGGGAIYADRNLTIFGGSFTENKAKFGGAIVSTDSWSSGSTRFTLDIDGAAFSKNEATNAAGGAINAIGNVVVKNATFTQNTAATNGGAIYALTSEKTDANSRVLIENSTFTGNTATGNGGAIYYEQNTKEDFFGDTVACEPLNLTIRDTEFSNNISGDGGAIYVKGAGVVNFEVTQGKHLRSSGNTATNGAYYTGFLSIDGPLSVDTEGNMELNFNIAQNASYTIGVKGTGDDSYLDSITIRNHNAVVNKTGKGKLVVNSDSQMVRGTANVLEGELVINKYWGCEYMLPGGQTVRTQIFVKSGATLSGEGSLASATIEKGGILSPGDDAVGTLSFGNLTLEGGAILKIENGDKIDIWGNLTIGDTSIDKILIDLLNFLGETGDYNILTYGTRFGADGTDLSEYFDFGGKFTGSIYDDGAGGIWMNGTVVPEPSTYAAIFGLFALGFAVYKRRK